jgi:antitoxin (DNA-binding transcriptional repressor) of toxin-antitoxin stability system
MKVISVQQLSRDTPASLDLAQKERVIVTRNGKPLAMLLGIENKDAEDYALERDEAFWQLIHERRKERRMIPLAEVRKRLRRKTVKTTKPRGN